MHNKQKVAKLKINNGALHQSCQLMSALLLAPACVTLHF